MKLTHSILTVGIGVSLLGATSVLAQTPAATAGAPPAANQAQQVGQDENAEDAALLQQLEQTTPPSQAKSSNKNLWAPATAARAGGGGFGVMPALSPVTTSFRGQTLVARPIGTPRTLLVRTSSPEPKAQAALGEDLAVMAHILNKAIEDLPGGQGHPMNALGVDVYFTPGGSPMRSLYLDNYGAVFFLNVGFPLIAPPDKQQEEKPVSDSAWEDARQELYGQKPQEVLMGEPAEEYSQEKVDKLKETLLEALKNASNIRDLKADEFVTLFVSGGTSGGHGRARFVRHNNAPGALGGNTVLVDQLPAASKRTILTVRVSKADIDSYAKGKLSGEEFEKRARITAYPGDAAGGAEDGLVLGGVYNGRNRF